MPEEANLPIEQFETKIAQELFPQIKEELFLLDRTRVLALRSLHASLPHENPPIAKRVSSKLLSRMISDLRSIIILMEIGYDTQANCISASVFEGGLTIATIEDDEALAKEWVEWNDPKKTFRDAYFLCGQALKNLSYDLGHHDFLYNVYRQFCWAKHINPMFEQQGGLSKEGNSVYLSTGPDSEELTIRGIKYGCVFSTLFACMGLQSYITKHVLDENKAELIQEINEIAKEQKRLYERGNSIWGIPYDLFKQPKKQS
jgi:hypothetical protein